MKVKSEITLRRISLPAMKNEGTAPSAFALLSRVAGAICLPVCAPPGTARARHGCLPSLVIDPAQVVPDSILPDAELLSDFTVVEPPATNSMTRPQPGFLVPYRAPPHFLMGKSIFPYTFVEPETGVQRTPSVSAQSGRAMQPISRSCSRECCFVLIIPIAANGRTTVRLRFGGATKRSRKHSYMTGSPGARRVASC